MQALNAPSRHQKVVFKENNAVPTIVPEFHKGRPFDRRLQKTIGEVPISVFAENRLLARLVKENSALLPLLEKVSLKSCEKLQAPEERTEYLYFPVTAVVSEYQMLADGATVEVAMIGSEGAVGLLALLETRSSVNWAQVMIPGTAYKIKSEALGKQLFCDASVTKPVFGYIEEYVRQISQRSICNSFHTIEERFCSWLLMLSERQNGSRFPLTQEQIAAALGVHRPSLTHIAQNLRKDQIIDYRRAVIAITNRSELKRRSCHCYDFEAANDRI